MFSKYSSKTQEMLPSLLVLWICSLLYSVLINSKLVSAFNEGYTGVACTATK